MNILIVGPGALGCLLAARISKGLRPGDSLSLLDHNQERAEQLNRSGLCYEQGPESLEYIPIHAVSTPEAIQTVAADGGFDVAIFCVKSYDLPQCLNRYAPHLQNSLLLLLQNGISHLELSRSWEERGYRFAFGTTTEGATLIAPGHVRHAGHGETWLGFTHQPTAPGIQAEDHNRLELLAQILNHGSVQTGLSDSVLSRIWTKLLINVGINALTATLDCPNGELLTRPDAAERMANAVQEAATVAAAAGIDLPDAPLDAVHQVCRKTAANISSMLQDVRKGRTTEIDAINGAVVRLAEKYSLPTPENSRLMQEVQNLSDLPAVRADAETSRSTLPGNQSRHKAKSGSAQQNQQQQSQQQ